jgi:hypothetical protein
MFARQVVVWGGFDPGGVCRRVGIASIDTNVWHGGLSRHAGFSLPDVAPQSAVVQEIIATGPTRSIN